MLMCFFGVPIGVHAKGDELTGTLKPEAPDCKEHKGSQFQGFGFRYTREGPCMASLQRCIHKLVGVSENRGP